MTRKPIAATSLALACLASPALPDERVAAYYTEFGYEDFFNSRGTALLDVGAVVQQDRANFHRFGIRHNNDESDPYFADRATRATIPDLVRAGPVDAYLQGVLGQGWQGWSFNALVQVCGNGTWLTRIIIDPADGDGYSSC